MTNQTALTLIYSIARPGEHILPLILALDELDDTEEFHAQTLLHVLPRLLLCNLREAFALQAIPPTEASPKSQANHQGQTYRDYLDKLITDPDPKFITPFHVVQSMDRANELSQALQPKRPQWKRLTSSQAILVQALTTTGAPTEIRTMKATSQVTLSDYGHHDSHPVVLAVIHTPASLQNPQDLLTADTHLQPYSPSVIATCPPNAGWPGKAVTSVTFSTPNRGYSHPANLVGYLHLMVDEAITNFLHRETGAPVMLRRHDPKSK